MKFQWNIYTSALTITILIFGIAYLLSNFFYERRLDQVGTIEQNITLNILATEVDFALLSEAICESDGRELPSELGALTERLSYLEEQKGTKNEEVINLKKYYSLLQIKDYLFLKERARQCGIHTPSVLYFYSNTGECEDCQKQGYVLTGIQRDYPELMVYSFDYRLDLSAIATLRSVYGLSGELPVVVINRIPYYGFHDREALLDLLPELKLATSTEE